MKRLLLALLLVFPRLAHSDDTAALAYQQAEQLEKQGKFAEACPLYDASYRADPQIGVLLHLANCHEHIGKLASAWAEFNDAVELAHRRGDNREALAQQRADALKPKLAYLHIAPPAAPPPGLAVYRDGLDVTVLVGTDMPIDSGEHEIRATAPGYLEFTKKLTVGALPTTTQLAIPALDKQPAVTPVAPPPPPPPAVPHDGSLTITTRADAHVAIDGADVGTGGFTGKLKPGGHQLRVTAPGMRSYQSEVFIGDGEARTIDVPLENEPVAITVAPQLPPAEELPTFEIGLGMAPGEKFHEGNAAEVAYRFDFGFRFGRRVNFGAFVEYASLSASNTCGTAIPGPALASMYDYGAHYRFDSCSYANLGLQLFIHILPGKQIDPYVGISPGFRFQFIDLTAYQNGMATGAKSSQTMPGIGFDSRVGVDYHPTTALPGWAVGAFVDLHTMIIANENLDNSDVDKNASYVSLFGGVRSSLAF